MAPLILARRLPALRMQLESLVTPPFDFIYTILCRQLRDILILTKIVLADVHLLLVSSSGSETISKLIF